MNYAFIIDQMEWSYSRLTAFEQCPYQWYLKYIYGLEEKQSKFFSDFGSWVHQLLEDYFTGRIPKEQLAGKYLSGFRAHVIGEAPSQKIRQSYLEQGKQYFKRFSFPAREILLPEEKIHFNFAGHPFVVIIDLQSLDEEGKLCITDHKSHNLKPRSGRKKPTRSDEELDRYLRQLYLYAAAVREKHGAYPDYLEFNCFRTGTFIREPFRKEKLRETEQWAEDLIRTIRETDDWQPKEDYWFCTHLCDASGECKYREE